VYEARTSVKPANQLVVLAGEVASLRADNDLQKGAGDLAALRPNGYFRSFPHHRTDERRLRAEVPGAIAPEHRRPLAQASKPAA
jgi:hypothetical protein